MFAESTDIVTIQRLERGKVTKVFDQAKFEKHLTEFNNGLARQPSSEVLLVIGQNPNNDRSKYLIYVKVAGSKASNQLVSGHYITHLRCRCICVFESFHYGINTHIIMPKCHLDIASDFLSGFRKDCLEK